MSGAQHPPDQVLFKCRCIAQRGRRLEARQRLHEEGRVLVCALRDDGLLNLRISHQLHLQETLHKLEEGKCLFRHGRKLNKNRKMGRLGHGLSMH
jgi:hypothetical protein